LLALFPVFKVWPIKKQSSYKKKMRIVHILRRGQSFLGLLKRSYHLPPGIKIKKVSLQGRGFWKSSPRLKKFQGRYFVKPGKNSLTYLAQKI
jgi:hypothetical protein